jgi:hypothetical protein
MNHSFNVDIAKKYGVECAIILENMQWWIAKNKANRKHFYKGRYWTYNSAKSFSELFPYWSKHQIGRFLRRLEHEGLVVSGNFNKAGYDHTKWYSVNDSLILQICNIECAELQHRMYENAQPIPYINTDINTDNNIEERKLKFASTLKPFVDVYGKDFLNSFYAYWTEPNKSNTKFKQELEKTWGLERRLQTWAKNDVNFNKGKNGKSNVTDTEQFKDLAKAIRSTGDRI